MIIVRSCRPRLILTVEWSEEVEESIVWEFLCAMRDTVNLVLQKESAEKVEDGMEHNRHAHVNER